MSHLKLQRLQDSAYWWLFLLCMVNISGFLSHKIPKYTNTNTIYFDWQKNQITAQTRKELYIYDFHIEGGEGGAEGSYF